MLAPLDSSICETCMVQLNPSASMNAPGPSFSMAGTIECLATFIEILKCSLSKPTFALSC
jgi:hypothetical protein